MSLRNLSAVVLFAGIAAGTLADRPVARPPVTIGGYRVLAADFHIHSSTWSDGALTPWGLVLEAERQGLDVIGITGHNQVSDGKAARWFSRRVTGPTVIVGQEILSPGHHVIGIGTESVVDSRLSVADQVEAIHRQGGVAIAAHPLPPFWPAFDGAAMRRLPPHALVADGGSGFEGCAGQAGHARRHRRRLDGGDQERRRRLGRRLSGNQQDDCRTSSVASGLAKNRNGTNVVPSPDETCSTAEGCR